MNCSEKNIENLGNILRGLENLFPSREILFVKDHLEFDLAKLKDADANTFYYGLISNSKDNQIQIFNNGNLEITINPNSQIIELFQNLNFIDDTTLLDVATCNGKFRGYKIILSK